MAVFIGAPWLTPAREKRFNAAPLFSNTFCACPQHVMSTCPRTEPAGFLAPFQTRGQRAAFFPAQAGARLVGARPGEPAFFQSLGANPPSAAVPEQNLEPGAIPIGEDKPVAGERVLLQYRLRQREELIETAAQICRLRGHKHACGRGEVHHARKS